MLYGRNEELRWLRARFDAIAERDADGAWPGPRMAVVVAESGIGKSRLVQELYLQLTHDSAWDPPEIDYWPDAFGDGGVNLAVTPDMRGHVPNGPPRFAWLGARWQSPDERSVVTRRSALPDLRSSVMVHAEILRSHGSAWSDAARRAVAVARDEGIGAVADAVGIPFFGLVTRLAGSLKDFAEDRMAGGRSFEQVEAEEVTSEVDEVLDCMRLLLDGKGALPTILWLDDGHWIDDESRAFVHRLWLEATRRRWPLLVVATHWEREWRELAPSRGGLHAFEGQPGVDVWHMTDAGTEALREYLRSQFPGLEPAQQSLLIEKAGGNFLTMVENVGELRRHPANFVGKAPTGPLSTAGLRKVETWESLREKRVQQRFGDLEPEVQDLLGWGSHIGQRFLRGVVEEFAERVGHTPGAASLVERCVDPYVILGRAGEHTREFRDRAFYAVAVEHFNTYGHEHAALLSDVLRQHLIEWVQNSFDEAGHARWPQDNGGLDSGERMATALADEERRDLLALAVRELAPGHPPDWSKGEDVAALRAVYLCAINAQRERSWDVVALACRTIESISMEELPTSILAVREQESLSDAAGVAGALGTAETLARLSLGWRRQDAARLNTADCRQALANALSRVADIEREHRSHSSALEKYQECLLIRRQLADQHPTLDSRRDVAEALCRIGLIKERQGAAAEALAAYNESLDVARDFFMAPPHARRYLAISLSRLADIDLAEGRLDSARMKYEEVLALSRSCVEELDTPQSRRDLSITLGRLAEIERRQGCLTEALGRHEEGLALARQLAAELNTPKSRRDLSISLVRMADTERTQGALVEARAKYEESLALRRQLAEELGTPQSRRDLSFGLRQVADIERTQGALTEARAKYEESLALNRQLAEELGTLPLINSVVWVVQQLATCDIELGHASAASARLAQEQPAAEALESSSSGDLNHIDTCAAFWEARARAHRALGEDADATWCEERAAGLRQRIAGTK